MCNFAFLHFEKMTGFYIHITTPAFGHPYYYPGLRPPLLK